MSKYIMALCAIAEAYTTLRHSGGVINVDAFQSALSVLALVAIAEWYFGALIKKRIARLKGTRK